MSMPAVPRAVAAPPSPPGRRPPGSPTGEGYGRSFPPPAEILAMPAKLRREAELLAAESGVVLFPVAQDREPTAPRDGGFVLGQAEIGAAQVTLDIARLLDGRLLVQGASGSGKSWTLRRILERTAGLIQQIIIDPEGEFRSLTEAVDLTVVEAHRLDIAALATIAGRVRRHRLSVLVDLSDMDREGQMQAVAAFLAGLIEAPQGDWHPALVVIDEAHLFAPFGDQSSAATSVRKASIARVVDLMSRGRKRGLCGILATQRLARLSKSVTSEALNYLVGLNTLDLDIRRAAETIGWDARRAFDRLPMLGAGEFVAVGPAFSQSPCGLKVGPVETRHTGARPDLSAPAAIGAAAAAELLDLDALIAATGEDAAIRDEAALPDGARAVRALIRDPQFPLAGRIVGALRPLAPEGARVCDLADHLEATTVDAAAALALLDAYGVLEFSGDGGDRAARLRKDMVPPAAVSVVGANGERPQEAVSAAGTNGDLAQ